MKRGRSRNRRLAILLVCMLLAAGIHASVSEDAAPGADVISGETAETPTDLAETPTDLIPEEMPAEEEPEPEEPEKPEDPEAEEPAEEEPEEEAPAEAPGSETRRGGKKSRGGGSRRSGASGGITPGKALTSTHARGTGDTLAYGTVRLSVEPGGMQILTLGGQELPLDCGGERFTASLEGDVLHLVCGEGDGWRLTMDALGTLRRSGIRQVRLTGAESETSLDTDMELAGMAYGRERAEGFVSSDFRMIRQETEWRVQVEDREYRLAGNELE